MVLLLYDKWRFRKREGVIKMTGFDRFNVRSSCINQDIEGPPYDFYRCEYDVWQTLLAYHSMRAHLCLMP